MDYKQVVALAIGAPVALIFVLAVLVVARDLLRELFSRD